MPRVSEWPYKEREQLIDMVQKNPQLGNPKLPEYMRTDKGDDLWKQIGVVLNRDCKCFLFLFICVRPKEVSAFVQET